MDDAGRLKGGRIGVLPGSQSCGTEYQHLRTHITRRHGVEKE